MFSNKFMENSSFLRKEMEFHDIFFQNQEILFYFLENTRVFFFDMILIFCTYCQVVFCMFFI